jgi:hypothetical protein
MTILGCNSRSCSGGCQGEAAVIEEQTTAEPVVRELLCSTAVSLRSLRDSARRVNYCFAGRAAGIIASASRRREW